MNHHLILDRRLNSLIKQGETAEPIATGFEFSEGPVWNQAHSSLTFSDIPAGTIHRWTRAGGTEIYRRPSGAANGNTLDPDGNLLTCEHDNRRVSRTLSDERIESVASHFQDNRLNSPNDVVCAPNGDVFFTDPPYGLRLPDGTYLPGELSFAGVFCSRVVDGQLVLISDQLDKPNGLVLRDDGSTLLVADTDNHVIHSFQLAEDRSVQARGIFARVIHEGTEGRPDGMKLDRHGNLYVATNGEQGIWVFDPEGTLMGFLGIPEPPSNVAWGEAGWQSLFVTAKSSVYRLPMNVSGQPLASKS